MSWRTEEENWRIINFFEFNFNFNFFLILLISLLLFAQKLKLVKEKHSAAPRS